VCSERASGRIIAWPNSHYSLGRPGSPSLVNLPTCLGSHYGLGSLMGSPEFRTSAGWRREIHDLYLSFGEALEQRACSRGVLGSGPAVSRIGYARVSTVDQDHATRRLGFGRRRARSSGRKRLAARAGTGAMRWPPHRAFGLLKPLLPAWAMAWKLSAHRFVVRLVWPCPASGEPVP
jgi:hypothetical protein